MKVQRRRFIAAGAAGAAALGVGLTPRRAWAAPEYVLKFGFNLAESHPITARSKEAAAKILQESNGRLEIRVFPNNQLGSDQDMFQQIRAGALDLFLNSGINVLSTMIPSASVYGLGFIFPDLPAVWRAMDGEVGAYVRTQIRKAGLVPLDKMWDNGFRHITTSTKPINTPKDLAGLKIRVPVGALWTSMFKDFRAAPTTINFNELYSALQTKIVDAQENSLANIVTAKLFEVQKYLSLTNHMWDGFFCIAQRASWEGLPADLRELANKHINNAALLERQDMAANVVTYLSQLKEKGLVVDQPATAPFREALVQAGFYKEWRAKYGEELWGLLEKSCGSLG
ncbi:TRAP transporter substrate-binding protein [Variovorax ureilyticus]|uniref:TRAP transporter substrate-binding protein n=1 Tax=Variovorax ureilyticus TaxID=1836198 RepID=A0ABU8VPV7_9BURK